MKRTTWISIAVLGIASLPLLTSAKPRDISTWSQWRGPERRAQIDSEQLRDPATLLEAWGQVVGEGQSSPIVGPARSGGHRVYVHSRHADRETIQALELKTGEVIWTKSFDEPPCLPSLTPVI